MSERTLADLKQKQALPLEVKILLTRERVRQWIDEYGEDGVYVSFSGGIGSTVLLHLVRNVFGYKDVKGVFIDTGLEYPEIRQFVKTFENIDWIKPKMNFRQVLTKYGFPFASKEVSESVEGARRYLAEIIDRQTDRQIIPYRYFYEKVTGTGQYAKKVTTPSIDEKAIEKPTRGGADNKYRKLRGIGEYSKRTNESKVGRFKSKISDNARNADKGQGESSSGEYP